MTTLLEQALAKAAQLPKSEQELLVSRLLAEHRGGLTEELDPGRL